MRFKRLHDHESLGTLKHYAKLTIQDLKRKPDRIKGARVLTRELGAAGMVQFMQQFTSGRGDYSKERHKLLDTLTVDDIVDGIRRKRAKR
jgi:hypothetical protein